ncbi:RND superfamily drug exporter [Anopheles sinensis]|uniref:RND superfamily drug exporter n=1 Tax=Anopheles sinensis TaxID=74873 RepID=A0A084VIY4_ANOSI|nr:RND superfamily drug exporter [Anopheles sinensis]
MSYTFGGRTVTVEVEQEEEEVQAALVDGPGPPAEGPDDEQPTAGCRWCRLDCPPPLPVVAEPRVERS